jgi:hypothetical protein
MVYCDQDLLNALRSDLPVGERYQLAMVIFEDLFCQNRERVTALITARARDAYLDPDEVLDQTIRKAGDYLEQQARKGLDAYTEEQPASFEFTGDPGIEGWLLLIAGSRKYKQNGGVIPTRLANRHRNNKREQLVSEHSDNIPDESYDETAALLQSIDLERLFADVDPADRCLFELNKGGLSDTPSADAVVAHALQTGMPPASIDLLRERAKLMAWPDDGDRTIEQKKLAILFGLKKEEVAKRIRATMRHLRNQLDRSVSPCPHWSAVCGKRKTPAHVEYG